MDVGCRERGHGDRATEAQSARGSVEEREWRRLRRRRRRWWRRRRRRVTRAGEAAASRRERREDGRQRRRRWRSSSCWPRQRPARSHLQTQPRNLFILRQRSGRRSENSAVFWPPTRATARTYLAPRPRTTSTDRKRRRAAQSATSGEHSLTSSLPLFTCCWPRLPIIAITPRRIVAVTGRRN